MNEVVINTTFGGFGLSNEALDLLRVSFTDSEICKLPRHHPKLVEVIKELGRKADGEYASLHVCEIPGNQYSIIEYDGAERIICPETYEWTTIN